MSTTIVNQKEYLKKYLGKKVGEKKKKKSSSTSKEVRIIDDDQINYDDLCNTNNLEDDEDAPQIVAIIDDRPPSLRLDEKTNQNLWKPISDIKSENSNNIENNNTTIKGIKLSKITNKSLGKSLPGRQYYNDNKQINSQKDLTTKRKNNVKLNESTINTANLSIKDVITSTIIDNISLSKKHKEDINYSSSHKKINDDTSPPIKRRRDRSHSIESDDVYCLRNEKNDIVKSSRKVIDNDISPPRKNKYDIISSARNRNYDDMSPPRKIRNSDISPPRNRSDNDLSPPRQKRNYRKYSNSSVNIREQDRQKLSSIRTYNYNYSEPLYKESKSIGTDDGFSSMKNEKNPSPSHTTILKKWSKGAHSVELNPHTIIRDRKTGRIQDFDEETRKQEKKQEEENKQKEKYSRWGKGLVQVEKHKEMLEEQLNEINKPLARYADDADLEKYLKEKEREGDPMLAYLNRKRKKDAAKMGIVEKPQFEGEFMPNRYGIRPGHRWDGVDRSNGYEEKYFKIQNKNTALKEESYKWSTEDM